ncbi:MAG: halocarboxylic acid dehydrogenase DehI family protein, partial [Thermoplasmata archaeon]
GRFLDENDAKGDIFAIYHDIKDTLGVRFVPDIFRYLGVYPSFLTHAWPMIKEIVGSRDFEERADELRHNTTKLIDGFDRKEYHEKVKNSVGVNELKDIDDALSLFYYVDPKLCLILIPIERALSEHGVKHYETSERVLETPLFSYNWKKKIHETEISFVEEEEARGKVKEIYNDIKSTEGLKFVSRDYLSLGKWSGYLASAWTSLKKHINSENYISTVAKVREYAVELTDDYEIPIEVEKIKAWEKAWGVSNEDVEDIRYAMLEFSEYLPKLTTNITILWKGAQELLGKEPVI